MSGILIDIDTKAESAKRDLRELNQNLARLVTSANSSSKALDGIKPEGFKNLTGELRTTVKSFSAFKEAGTTAFNTVGNAASSLVGVVSTLKTAMIALGTAFLGLKGVTELNKAADNLTNIQNKIKLVIDDTEELVKTQTKLYEVSRASRSTLSETTGLYVDFTKALEETGASQGKILKVVSTIQKSLVLSGASAAGAQGALVQLGQGIASGTLRGEELNSVLEQMKYLGLGLKKELGLNAGSLRKFAEEGQLTTELLMDVIEKLADKTDSDFAKTTITVETAAIQFKQSLSLMFGEVNKYLGTSDRLSKLLIDLSYNIDEFSLTARFKLEAARLSFSNYFTKFKLIEPKDIIINDLINFDLSKPITTITQTGIRLAAIQKIKDVLSFLDDDLTKELGLVTKVKISLDLLTGKGTDKETSLLDQLPILAFNKTLDEFYASVDKNARSNPFSDFFVILAENLGGLIPLIRTPIQTIDVDFRQFLRSIAYEVYFFKLNLLRPLRLLKTELKETFNLFEDTSLERAWVKLFWSSDLVTFKQRLADLNVERKSLKDTLQNTSFILTEGFRSFGIQDLLFGVQDLLVYLNIVDNTFLKIRDTRFDRTLNYFERLGEVLSAVYERVILPKIRYKIYPIQLQILALREAYEDAYNDVFNESTANKIGKRLGNFLGSTISGVDIFPSITLNPALLRKSVDVIQKVLTDLFVFIRGFFKGLTNEIGNELVDLSFVKYFISLKNKIRNEFQNFLNYINRLISKIPTDISFVKFDFKFLGNIKVGEIFEDLLVLFRKIYQKTVDILTKVEDRIFLFAKKVKNNFLDIYDKVVGNSYWPDTINEIYQYTSNLSKTELALDEFKKRVSLLFLSIYTTIKQQSNKFGISIKESINRIMQMDVNQLGQTLSKSIGGSIIASLLLLSDNSIVKLSVFSYFAALLNGSLKDLVSFLTPAFATIGGAAFAGFAEGAIKGFFNILNATIEALPYFLNSALNSLIKIPEGVKTALEAVYSVATFVFPVIGVLVENNLIRVLATASILLAILNKDFRKFAKTFFFGSAATKKKPAVLGITDYLSSLLPGAGVTKKFVSIFQDPKIAIAAGLVLSTALLESISILDAVTLGVPLLIWALLGKDGGGRLIRDISNIIEILGRQLYVGFVGLTEKFTGKSSIFSKAARGPLDFYDSIFNKPVKPAQIKATQQGLGSAIALMFTNLKRNLPYYASGGINLWEAFTFKAPTGNLLKDFTKTLKTGEKVSFGGRVDLKKDFGNSLQPLLDFIELAKLRLKAFYSQLKVFSAAAAQTITAIAAPLLLTLSSTFKVLFTTINVGLATALALFKRSFLIIVGIVLGSIAGIASAAVSTTIVVGGLASVFSVLAFSLTAVATGFGLLGAAFKGFQFIKRGRELAERLKSQGGIIDVTDRSSEYKAKRDFDFNTKYATAFEKFKERSVKNRNAILSKLDLELANKTAAFQKEREKALSPKQGSNYKELLENLRRVRDQELELDRIRGRREAFAKGEKDKVLERKFRGDFKRNYEESTQKDTERFRKRQEKDIKFQERLSNVSNIPFAGDLLAIGFGLTSAFDILKDKLKDFSGAAKNLNKTSIAPLIESFSALFTLFATGGFKALMSGLGSFGTNFTSILGKILIPLGRLLILFGKIIGVITGIGVLGLWIFGPGRTLFENLEWAYDKIRDLFDLKPATGKGTFLDVFSSLDKIEKTSIGVNLKPYIEDVDFTKVPKAQREAFVEVAKELEDTILNLEKLSFKQGGLNPKQKEERDTAIKNYKEFALRLPRKDAKDLNESLEQLRLRILKVDNSTGALIVRLLGLQNYIDLTSFEKITKSIRAWFSELGSVIVDTVLAFIILKLGTVAGRYLGILAASLVASAVAGVALAAGAIPAAVVAGAGATAGAIVGAIGAVFYLALKHFAPGWLASIQRLLTQSISSMESTTDKYAKGSPPGQLDSVIPLPIRAINNIANLFVDYIGNKFKQRLDQARIIPSLENMKKGSTVLSVESSINSFGSFVTPEDKAALAKASQKYFNAIEIKDSFDRRDASIEKDGGNNLDEAIGNYKKFLSIAETNLLQAEEEFNKTSANILSRAKSEFNIDNIKKQMKSLSDASTILGIDFGKDNIEFVGTIFDIQYLEDLADQYKKINKLLEVTEDISDRTSRRLEQSRLSDLAKARKELITPFSTQQGTFKKLSETLQVPETTLNTAQFFDIEAFKNTATQIVALEAQISKSNDSNAIKRFTAKILELRLEASKRILGSTWVDDLNIRLKALNTIEFNPIISRLLSPEARTLFEEQIKDVEAAVKTAGAVGATPADKTAAADLTRNLGYSQISTGLKALLPQQNKTIEGANRTSEALDKSIPTTVGAKGKAAIIQYGALQYKLAGLNAELKSLKENSALSGQALPEKQFQKLNSEINRVEEDINKLTEKPVVITFDAILSSLTGVGIEIDRVLFAGLKDSNLQQIILSAGSTIEKLQKKFSETPASAQATKAYGDAVEKAAAPVTEGLAKSLVTTGKILSESLSGLGVQALENLSENAIILLFDLSKKIKEEKRKLEKDLDLGDTKSVQAYIAGLKTISKEQKTANNFAEDLSQTFSTRLSSINDLFKTSLTENDLISAGVDFGIRLGDAARYFKREFENVMKDGKTSLEESGEVFMRSFEKVQRSGALLTFFSEFKKTFSDIVVEGAKASFDRFSSVFQNFGIDFNQFTRLESAQRRSLSKQAANIQMLEKAAELAPIDPELGRILENLTVNNAEEILAKFNTKLLEVTQKTLKDALKTPVELNTTSLEANTSAIRDWIAAFTGKPKELKTTDVSKENDSSSLGPADVKLDTVVVTSKRIPKENNNEGTQSSNSVYKTLEDFRRITAKTSEAEILKLLSIREQVKFRAPNVDQRALNLATPEQLINFSELSKGLKEEEDKLRTATDATAAGIQANVDIYNEKLTTLTDIIISNSTKLADAGKAFESSITSDLYTNFSDLLKGRAEEGKSAWKTFIDKVTGNITSTVVDTFAKGLLDPIIGKGGAFQDFAQNFGKSIFSLGNKASEEGANLFSNTTTPSYLQEGNIPPGEESGVGGFFSSITGFFGSMLALLTGQTTTAAAAPITISTAIAASTTAITAAIALMGSMITSAIALSGLGGGGGGFGSLLSLAGTSSLGSGSMFWASGGQIKGPGTGTSDSIPAMLSNGEFIVNAKQSAKHLRLLAAINNGEVKKFAMGGMVGNSSGMLGLPSNSSNQSSSQQVFNINVTGDISRQTKREIVSMMPQIASGVNYQNRENNISRRTET